MRSSRGRAVGLALALLLALAGGEARSQTARVGPARGGPGRGFSGFLSGPDGRSPLEIATGNFEQEEHPRAPWHRRGV